MIYFLLLVLLILVAKTFKIVTFQENVDQNSFFKLTYLKIFWGLKYLILTKTTCIAT